MADEPAAKRTRYAVSAADVSDVVALVEFKIESGLLLEDMPLGMVLRARPTSSLGHVQDMPTKIMLEQIVAERREAAGVPRVVLTRHVLEEMGGYPPGVAQGTPFETLTTSCESPKGGPAEVTWLNVPALYCGHLALHRVVNDTSDVSLHVVCGVMRSADGDVVAVYAASFKASMLTGRLFADTARRDFTPLTGVRVSSLRPSFMPRTVLGLN